MKHCFVCKELKRAQEYQEEAEGRRANTCKMCKKKQRAALSEESKSRKKQKEAKRYQESKKAGRYDLINCPEWEDPKYLEYEAEFNRQTELYNNKEAMLRAYDRIYGKGDKN